MRTDAPVERRFQTRTTELCYFEWDGPAEWPLVLFLHATGFHARVWDETIKRLPRECRIVAVELRGHGRSADCPPIKDWREASDDIIDLVDGLGIEGAHGVGHSMGGHVAAAVEIARPGTFGGLTLCDPVLPPPEAQTRNRFAHLPGPEAHPVAKRRSRWPSWQAFHDHLKDREPYNLWQPETLVDYCRYGLLPAPDGDGLILACAPVLEASVYMNSWRARILDRLGEIACPATILRALFIPMEAGARINFARSSTWEGLAGYFRDGRDVYRPDLTHFIPMQAPDLVAEHVRAALAETASAP